jgi:hypothetical protein
MHFHFEQQQCTNCTAADTREPSAANAPIQRLAPSLSPTQNVNSAPRSLTAAGHFSGCNAKSANIANREHNLQELLMMKPEFGLSWRLETND